MKTNTNMTMSEMINFDREVVNYINDNLQYIKENADNSKNEDLAEVALEHYNINVYALSDEENYLSKEQEERFYNVATILFKEGHVAHAGHLFGNDD